MTLNWIQNTLLGLLSGLTELLPVSSAVHRTILLKLIGAEDNGSLYYLLVHAGILAAVYMSCRTQLVRFARARAVARIPKRRRKRPLDTKSLMDLHLLRTMLFPMILAYLFYSKTQAIGDSLVWLAALLFVNGILLYIPQFLPGCNKDSRTLTRLEGFLLGLGQALGVFPGVSGMGASVSIGSMCGVERSYAFNISLLAELGVLIALIVYDFIGIFSIGIGSVTILQLLQYLLAAAAAFGGAYGAIKLLRALAAGIGLYPFAFYCWGMSLLTFILNLLA